jgi:hypothetical protein
MKTKYLHVSAYSCDKCEGPVIAGSFGTRETEITREIDLTQVGAVCLSCGNKTNGDECYEYRASVCAR